MENYVGFLKIYLSNDPIIGDTIIQQTFIRINF